jgi:type VI secretion system protein ImpM
MTGRFGAYGKIPALGDFVRIGLADDFVTAWDGWLQRGVLAAREALGTRWRDAYGSAPVWRFALAAGLAGEAGALGVLTPSIDRVGRLFPLTLAAALPLAQPPALAHFLAAEAFDALEAAALDALDAATTRDALARRLAAIAAPALRPARPLDRLTGALAVTGDGPNDPLPDLASALVAERFARPSLWSGAAGGGHRLLVCEGLPDPLAAGWLFDAARGAAAQAPA